MNDQSVERLVGCFEQAFPKLNRDAILTATSKTVSEWDSLMQITLLSLIGEAFAIDIDFEEFEGATSFASILELVKARAANVTS